MGKYIIEELKRAFISKSIFISLILAFLCILIGVFEAIFYYPSNNAIGLLLLAHSGGTTAVLSLAFPLLVAIPFVSSYVVDVKTGFIRYMYIKIGRLRYLTIRLIVNGLVSGFILFFSLSFSFLLFFLIYGIKETTTYMASLNYSNIFNTSPVIYVLFIVLLSSLSGVVFASLGLGVSTFIKNKYISTLFPFLFLIFSGTFLIQINIYFNAAITYNINFFANIKLSYVLLYDIILLLIGIGMFYIGSYKNVEEIV